MNQVAGREGSAVAASQIRLVIGIDLGTTNSVMAIARPSERDALLPVKLGEDSAGTHSTFVPVQLVQLPQILLDGVEISQALFPSVVFQASPDSDRFVGAGAAEAKYSHRKGLQVFYSVKMDLGLDAEYAYPSAPVDLNNPVKVSAVILRAMREAAESILGEALNNTPTIITVPASFQSSQRQDTVKAAQLAGFTAGNGDLLDEPNAALLGYINQQRAAQRWSTNETVLVFDFGGGTCDISIIDVTFTRSNRTLQLDVRAISRFEQLGGDDIDHHIAHSELIPMFYLASDRSEGNWGFGERKNVIWSQLYRVAEQLKIRYCRELDKVSQATRWNEESARQVRASLPAQRIQTSKGEFVLDGISMDWSKFKRLMAPFIDPQPGGSQDKTYYRLTSIFSPIIDTLDKAHLKPQDITRVLLVGGSSYNPMVEKALRNFFVDATIDRPEHMEYLVAEGAAVHAYYHFFLGHDLLAPIVGDTIGLLTEGMEFVALIPAGSRTPFPNETEWVTYRQFRVPRAGMKHVDIVICAGNASRPVHTIELRFDREVPANAIVDLRVRLDSNKVFHVAASLPDYRGIEVVGSLENPLSILPVNDKMKRKLELESKLKRAAAQRTLDQHTDVMLELADALRDLGRSEESLEWLSEAERRGGATTESRELRAYSLYALGKLDQAHEIYAALAREAPRNWVYLYMASASAQDPADREDYMRKAVEAAPSNGTVHVGLARVLAMKGDAKGRFEHLRKAKQLLDTEVQVLPSARSLSLLANICDELDEPVAAKKYRQRAAAAQLEHTDVDGDSLIAVATLPPP